MARGGRRELLCKAVEIRGSFLRQDRHRHDLIERRNRANRTILGGHPLLHHDLVNCSGRFQNVKRILIDICLSVEIHQHFTPGAFHRLPEGRNLLLGQGSILAALSLFQTELLQFFIADWRATAGISYLFLVGFSCERSLVL